MLIKRIHILKGKGCSGTLKLKNLEGAYCEIELSVYNISKRDLCFILKAGTFLLVDNLDGSTLKRKIRCIDADSAYSAIVDRINGEILMWAGETPTPPSFLLELATKQKYPVVKRKEEKPLLEETPASEKETEPPFEDKSIGIDSEHDKEEKKDDLEAEPKTLDNETSIEPSMEERFGITSLSVEDEKEEVSESTESVQENEEKELPFKLALAKEILEKYHLVEHNSELESLCHDSKWIIETSSEKDFSLGVLFDSDGNPTHVCYAHKGMKNNPPDFTSEWLSDNDIEGYWVVYEEID